MISEKILLVDDDPKILSALSRGLLEEDITEIQTALNGPEALEILKNTPEMAVIVSDYHMPSMSGIELLIQARQLAPDATRLMLTGAADLTTAVEAVNRGNIFRLLLKPCPSDLFIENILDAIKQYQLITSEKTLLSKTLNGSIKVMIDILAALDPYIFAQSIRLRTMARDLAKALEMEDQSWEIELAALLCRIGAVTIPSDILDKVQMGVVLDDPSKEMYESIPKISSQLISNIPRMERIAEAVAYQDCTYGRKLRVEDPTGEGIPMMARMLKIIYDFDRFQENTFNNAAAFQSLKQREVDYDPKILETLRSKVLHIGVYPVNKFVDTVTGEKAIYVDDIKVGMVLAKDIISRKGTLIVSRGTIITDVIRYRLINYFHSQAIIDPVLIESSTE